MKRKLVIGILGLVVGYRCYLLFRLESSLFRGGFKDAEEGDFRPTTLNSSREYHNSVFGSQNNTTHAASQLSHSDPVCYRQCSSYENRIAFYGPLFSGRGAGLNDRQWIMTKSADLAAFLCAKLIVPAPHFMLGPEHNGGKRVSEKLTWTKDFIEIRYLQNRNMSAIMQQPINEYDNKHDLGDSLKAMIKSRNLTWIESKRNPADIAKGLREAYQRVRRNQLTGTETPFLWTIHQDFWTGHNKIIVPELEKLGIEFNETSMLPMNCKGTFLQRSAPASLVLRRSLEQLQQQKRNSSTLLFGNLHLRRGDAIKACNTSVAKVREYLECSLGEFRPPTQEFILTLSTDETSTDYIQKIGKVIESLGFVFVHLDALVRSVVQEEVNRSTLSPHHANNFITFMATQGVSQKAQFHLERRREVNCWDCADWLQEKLKSILEQ